MCKKNKRKIIIAAYESGVRRCFVCNCQLVWKSPTENGVTRPKNLATIDHIIPTSSGGRDLQDNYVVMCSSCNNKRGNRTFKDFARLAGIDKELADTLVKKAVFAHMLSIVQTAEKLNPALRRVILNNFNKDAM